MRHGSCQDHQSLRSHLYGLFRGEECLVLPLRLLYHLSGKEGDVRTSLGLWTYGDCVAVTVFLGGLFWLGSDLSPFL